MTKENWKYYYIQSLHDGNLSEANDIKRKNLPKKLYRFEKVEDCRLVTLKRNALYVSHSTVFDDPYDAKGYYWKETELKKIFQDYNIFKKKYAKISIDQYMLGIEDRIKFWFEHCWIGCFTENLNNFPMWYYYADRYQGFCVEYDFSILSVENEFQQALKPVLYLNRKFDITKAIESSFNPDIVAGRKDTSTFYWLHTIGNIVKDSSWEFEKEWRYIGVNEEIEQKGMEIKLPVKPSHIYIGKDMSDVNTERIKKIAEEIGCDYSRITITDHNNEQFVLNY